MTDITLSTDEQLLDSFAATVGGGSHLDSHRRVREEILRRMAAGTVRDAVEEFTAGLYDSNYETRGGPALERRQPMLNWTEDFDDDDNSIWEAASPFHDDGSPFYFRLKQRLCDNRIEWYDASDSECSLGGDFWLTLEEAKAACEEARRTIISEFDR